MTFVIITAGIDLSVGSILAFAGVVLASALRAGLPIPIAILVGLGTGMFCGLVNGALIIFGKLPPFISTLGMMSVARGAALMYSHGRPISGFSSSFRFLATGEFFHIPMPVIIMIVVYFFAHFVLTRTKLDRYTESYLNEMQVFIDCLKNDEQPPVSGKDGLLAVAVGLAAMKSVRENRPVKMTEIY